MGIFQKNPVIAPIRVLIVDDHPVIQESLCFALNDDPRIQVVGQAMSGNEALQIAGKCKPEVIVMDYSMPGMSGIEATCRISHDFPGIHIVAYSSTDMPTVMDEMLKAGAEYFCTKGDPLSKLLDAIHHAAEARP